MTELVELASRFRSTVVTLTVASASYDIWWFYTSKETRDLAAMNRFPSFFLYDCEAHFRTMIIGLYTLYDTHPGTITIKSLIHELDEHMASPIWRKYKSVHKAVEKLAFLRHNVIAHRNADESYNDLFARAQLKPDDLETLISDSLALLTMIAVVVDVEAPILSPFVKDETRVLLTGLKVG
jgi:hypothetical protein